MARPSRRVPLTGGEQDAITDAKNLLATYDYVTIKRGSYEHKQERVRVADALRRYSEECAESTRRWAEDLCDEIRDLRERVTFLYGAAIAAGATREQLSGSVGQLLDELDQIDVDDESEMA